MDKVKGFVKAISGIGFGKIVLSFLLAAFAYHFFSGVINILGSILLMSLVFGLVVMIFGMRKSKDPATYISDRIAFVVFVLVSILSFFMPKK